MCIHMCVCVCVCVCMCHAVMPRSSPSPVDKIISFIPSGIQPDNVYFGVAETCSCNIQRIH